MGPKNKKVHNGANRWKVHDFGGIPKYGGKGRGQERNLEFASKTGLRMGKKLDTAHKKFSKVRRKRGGASKENIERGR